MYLKDLLEKDEYLTTDPDIIKLIDDEIRQQIVNLETGAGSAGKGKKGKSSQEQSMLNLRNSQNQFQHINEELRAIEDQVNYQEDQHNHLKRERSYQVFQPPRFKILGYAEEKIAGKIRRKPVFKMTDLYLTYNNKIRSLVNKIFEKNIYGKRQSATQVNAEGKNVIISKSSSNAQQLEDILKSYENNEDNYNLENMNVEYDEKQLEEYVIDHTHSKDMYFLYYKHQQTHPKPFHQPIKNHPLNCTNFIKELHRDVANMQRQYQQIQQFQIEEEVQQDDPTKRDREKHKNQIENQKILENDEKKDNGEMVEQTLIKKSNKEYFGQFKKANQKTEIKFAKNDLPVQIEDNFNVSQNSTTTTNSSKAEEINTISNQILNYFSHIDNQIIEQKYKKPLEEMDRYQLHLQNPQYFFPKLHTVFDKTLLTFSDEELKIKANESMRNMQNNKSVLSGSINTKQLLHLNKHLSAFSGDIHNEFQHQIDENQVTIEKIIETEIKNIYKEPLKHSEVAYSFEQVKFTLEEGCFTNFHRHQFLFHQYFYQNGKIKIQISRSKPLKEKPKGLVLNAEMKESNIKFSKKEDLSLAKGEFILIEYLEEVPLLMSNVGMCERMLIQVNYFQIIEKIKADIFNNLEIQEAERQRDMINPNQAITFEKHCQLWRKCIKETFGKNGKQMYWEPKKQGKLIGTPEGPGVIIMESDLAYVPIVKKNNNPKDFILVREGKKWFLRKIDNLYISGQVQPRKKVFCPGSRQHTQFKIAYEKAFIIKQIKQYGSVNFDQLKMVFSGETEPSLRRALKNSNTVSRDSRNYKLSNDSFINKDLELTPEDVCLYERMQKSLCQLSEVGICDIKSNQKMKNVLKEFNKKHYTNKQKFSIARMIRQQLQLTSWYLTDSFLKYKQKASKIQINGFADPTNGRGGYSYISKPQKERTSKEDMEEKVEKQKLPSISDLRKLNCESSRELLRETGHNQNQISQKGRWQLINLLKNKEGTEYSRKQRQTKMKKIENERKQISKNFNKLLKYLNDECEEPPFNYNRQRKASLEYYIQKEKENWQKAKKKYERMLLSSIKEEASDGDDSEDGDD